MNELTLALHEYKNLERLLDYCLDADTSDRVESWFVEMVCPVVSKLITTKVFKKSALWSVQHLTQEGGAKERKLVEKVDEELVNFATQLQACMKVIGRSKFSDSDRQNLDLIAERPWFDLVFAGDFCLPTRGLHLNDSNLKHTQNFQKRILRIPPSDYISRCLIARIEYWKEILEDVSNRIIRGSSRNTKKMKLELSNLFHKRSELEVAYEKLQKVCFNERQAQRREACTVLTIIYAAYAPLPDLQWMKFPPDMINVGAGMFRHSVMRTQGHVSTAERQEDGSLKVVSSQPASLCNPQVVRKIAQALVSVQKMYAIPEDPDEIIDLSREQAKLVLVDHSPRQVFWNGKEIVEKWDTRSVQWDFLWVLAQNPGKVIDIEMHSRPSSQSISSRRYRLKKMLTDCPELNNLIKAVRGQGHLLELDKNHIHLLESDGRGSLKFTGA